MSSIKIKVLQLHSWMRHYKDNSFVTPLKQIKPIYNRDGYYTRNISLPKYKLKSILCWFEYNGKAFEYDINYFNSDLNLLNYRRLTKQESTYIKWLSVMGLTSKTQLHALSISNQLHSLRRIKLGFLSTKLKICKKFNN